MTHVVCTVLLGVSGVLFLGAAFGLTSGGGINTQSLGLAFAAGAALALLLKLP